MPRWEKEKIQGARDTGPETDWLRPPLVPRTRNRRLGCRRRSRAGTARPWFWSPTGRFGWARATTEVARLVEDCVSEGVKRTTCERWVKDELPRHRVVLEAFYLDQYEVTNRRFAAFVEATGHRTTAEIQGFAVAYVRKNGRWQLAVVDGADWRKPDGATAVFSSNRAAHPVVQVSWHDAAAYCQWAGKRLPTEAEFEYATRAGTETRYWWGNGNPGARRVANVADEAARRQFGWKESRIMRGYDDGYAQTAPVGTYEANPWGV